MIIPENSPLFNFAINSFTFLSLPFLIKDTFEELLTLLLIRSLIAFVKSWALTSSIPQTSTDELPFKIRSFEISISLSLVFLSSSGRLISELEIFLYKCAKKSF